MRRGVLIVCAACAISAIAVFVGRGTLFRPVSPTKLTAEYGPVDTRKPALMEIGVESRHRSPLPPALGKIADPENFMESELPRRIRENVPALLIELRRENVASSSPGDPLELPSMGGITWTMQIERVSRHEALRATSVRGHIVDDELRYPASITLGETTTLATFSTSMGVFELRGTDSLAWVYRARDLRSPQHDAPDYVIEAHGGTRPGHGNSHTK